MLRSTRLLLGKRFSIPLQRRYNSQLTATCSAPYFFDSVSSGDGTTPSVIPAFRLLDTEGKISEGVSEEWRGKVREIEPRILKRLMKTMSQLPILDQILYSSQRQGRISFYMTSYGEEGAVVGSAAAWETDDEVFAQYREVGVLLWREYPLSSLMAQVFSSKSDTATKGRQMPVHYGSPEHHFHTISSPLATQIPQAAGAAYALKRTPGRENSCVICYAGEGATSEGDFHAGLNMASVLGGPLVFFVRNNGFAISTPSSQQYRGDGIASRGPAYGIETIRVDGNDPLAVYLVCKEARRKAVEGSKPVLVEAMSYRVSHHSTSDDSSAYRNLSEVESRKKLDSPIFRLRRHLESLPSSSSSEAPIWSNEIDEEMKTTLKREILKEFSKAEKEKKPRLEEMFKDVFAPIPESVREERGQGGSAGLERPQREQMLELKRLVEKWGETDDWKKELERFNGGRDAVLKW
ncbi:thiamine pyrophosphate-dependent dehydrogenase E1 component subunit alpha [Sporobolomyces salmoneus]|uniref:thiamine pyrophosphate-dependent dehydrogenase E1 component subunit alpha n=1 Tax=Sporobolomyces salmoneus TaxID=183962 RepID=UPI0031821B7D